MSCESERLGYLANCGSEPMAAEPVAVGANVYMIPQGFVGQLVVKAGDVV